MADELPEKVRALLNARSTFMASWNDWQGAVAVPLAVAETAARLAIEESTRELRERLERAQGALKPFANFSCSPPNKCACYNCVARDALAIREAKEGKNV